MYKLQKIKRKELDVEKYSKALNESLNYRIYAEVWYLDILTEEKWECWIAGDYEVIMPIPLQFKLGFKFVTMPIYCQQLGLFYKEEISDDLFKEFEKKLHQYRVRSYCFNEENTERYNPKGKKKVNHVLELNKPYDTIRKNYNRNRRRKLLPLPAGYRLLQSDSIDDFFNLYAEEYPHLNKKEWVEKLKQIMTYAFRENIGYQFRVEDDSSLLAASLFYIKTHRRLFQLGASRNKSNADAGFFTIIINHAIEKFSNTMDFKFDFEGSMLKGVALFNESFGAQKCFYTSYANFDYLKILKKFKE